MKMKRVVLAAALVAASSAFAQIFDSGDVYGPWFETNSVLASGAVIDTPDLNTFTFVCSNTVAGPSAGYVVTADVQIVIHAELPARPANFESTIQPKGAICAVETNVTEVATATNWYGLVNNEWAKLNCDVEPTEGWHSLVMEFQDSLVRYIIDGSICTTNSVDWLASGHGNAPQSVAFAGLGKWRYVKGLTVTAKVEPSMVSYWKEGFEFTNGTFAVTLDAPYTPSSMGTVKLVVTRSDGFEVVKQEATQGFANIAVTPTLAAGQTYTYAIETTVNGVATTNVLGSFVSAASGSFGASVTNGTVAAVFGGDWQGGDAPTATDSMYDIAGSEVFGIEGTCDGLTIVDNTVTFTTWGDANDMVDLRNDGTFAAITVVTNGVGKKSWKAFAHTGAAYEWVDLVGGVNPDVLVIDRAYDIRAVFDFDEDKVAYSAKEATSGEYIPFTYYSSAWLSIGDKSALSEVGYIGIGKLNSLVGGNSDTNLAAIGGTSYANLADAIAAATNGNSVVTLRTNTRWPSSASVGTYTVLTNGFSLVGLPPSGEGITITPSGVGFTVVVSSGSSHIGGAGNIQLDSAAMTALGIDASKTPAEIAADLTTPGANGIEKWVNYVLGINGEQAANKPYAAPVQNAASDKLAFSLGGVGALPAGSGATVEYEVETSTDGSTWSSGSTADPGDTVTVDAPTSGVKYYRVKVTITLPD